ncbi:MAG: hypothetical protein NZ898_14105 [Myxococcota bacterium]|nr:hypothetical protein [Myxococcota bacterium]MDW8362678.1 hypothetical protein [Myxococcales bacterium]
MTKKRAGLAVLAIVIAGSGYALAQTDAAEGEAEVGVRQRASLSGPEQLAEARRIEERATAITRRVAGMLEEARRSTPPDVLRITCLTDKLTQMQAHLQTLAERGRSLERAVQQGDHDLRDHEFTIISVLGSKFNVLEQEANQCLGQDIFETGATSVSTSIDPEVPEEDPENIGDPTAPGSPFVPPPGSPTV